MAIKLEIKTKQALNVELEEKRALYKALPEEQRASSQEYADFLLVEEKINKSLYSPVGISLPEAYINIQEIKIEKKRNHISIHLNIYANKELRDADEREIARLDIDLPYDTEVPAGDPLANAYNYIKTLDIFRTAIDC